LNVALCFRKRVPAAIHVACSATCYFFWVFEGRCGRYPIASMPAKKRVAARARGAKPAPAKRVPRRAPALDGRTATPADALAVACGVAADSAPAGVPDASAVAWPEGFGLAPAAGVLDVRRQARQMYWGGFRVAAIARVLNIKRTTLHSWAKSEKWSTAKPVDRVVGGLEVRLAYLIALPAKEGQHFKEIDLLARQMQRFVAPHFDGIDAPRGGPAPPQPISRRQKPLSHLTASIA